MIPRVLAFAAVITVVGTLASRDASAQALPQPLAGPQYRGNPGSRPPEKLDAYGAVVYALAHAPSLLSQQATVLTLDAAFAQARAGEYPTMSAQLQNQIARSANEEGQFAQFGLTPENNFSQNTAQLTGAYHLINGGQQLTAQEAKKQYLNAVFELSRQEEALTANVSSAFYRLAAYRGIVLLDQKDLTYQQTLLDSARAQEHVGRIAGVDVLRAQVAVARSSSALVQAHTDEANAREALAVQIGAPADSTFDVPEVLPEPAPPTTPLTNLATIAKMNRPEIAAARAALDQSKLANAAIDNDLRPSVEISGAFGSQVAPTNFVYAQQQIDASNASAIASYTQEKALFPFLNIAPPTLIPPVNRHVPGFWQFNIVSNFAIPLFDYGQRAASHHAARAQIDVSLANLYNAYDVVTADVNAAVRNLDAANQRLAYAKVAAQLGRESARIAQLQYGHGLVSFTDATQTEQTALSAENDLVAAQVTYVIAFIKLRVALAPPNPTAAADLRGL